MFVRTLCVAAVCLGSLASIAASPAKADVDIGYFGTNTLVFAPVGNAVSPDATGKGVIDYEGGVEPKSRWRATFKFTNLDPGEPYTVVVKGRTGDNGTEEARTLSPLCSFTTDNTGDGSCFWYFRGLARLNVAQVRRGDDDLGRRMLQASRDGDPGLITTAPNQYSPGGQLRDRKGGKQAPTNHAPTTHRPSNRPAVAPAAVETPTPAA